MEGTSFHVGSFLALEGLGSCLFELGFKKSIGDLILFFSIPGGKYFYLLVLLDDVCSLRELLTFRAQLLLTSPAVFTST